MSTKILSRQKCLTAHAMFDNSAWFSSILFFDQLENVQIGAYLTDADKLTLYPILREPFLLFNALSFVCKDCEYLVFYDYCIGRDTFHHKLEAPCKEIHTTYLTNFTTGINKNLLLYDGLIKII